MDGRLAPYLSQNQALQHRPRQPQREGDYLPPWRPSLGTAAWRHAAALATALRRGFRRVLRHSPGIGAVPVAGAPGKVD
jgi:hypothetical protein